MEESYAGSAVDEKAALLKKIREAVNRVAMDFQSKKMDNDELKRQLEVKQERVLDILNDGMRQLEEEKIRLGEQIEGLEEEARVALEGREKAEARAETAINEAAELEGKLKVALAEKADAERENQALSQAKAEAEAEVAATEAEAEEVAVAEGKPM